jgi:hypothetical protein
MKVVKLIKGLDYIGNGVKAVRDESLSVEDSTADKLILSGYFAAVPTETAAEEPKKKARTPKKGDE